MIYYLSLGANLGNREQTIEQALQSIEQQIGPILRRSSFYYSEPWGFDSPNTFCNLCCAVESDKAPLDVLDSTQAIERCLGRKEKSQIINHHGSADRQKSQITNYTDRCIDIDIIRAFDNHGEEIKCQITNNQSPMSNVPLLIIPHPLWQQRDFVKVPLSEIMQS